MGCVQAKVGDKKYSPNGVLLPGLEEPKAPPPTDARLPLTAREVFRLTKSWKGIRRNMQATGTEIFVQ